MTRLTLRLPDELARRIADARGFDSLNGAIVRRLEESFDARGTHVLVERGGRMVAVLAEQQETIGSESESVSPNGLSADLVPAVSASVSVLSPSRDTEDETLDSETFEESA